MVRFIFLLSMVAILVSCSRGEKTSGNSGKTSGSAESSFGWSNYNMGVESSDSSSSSSSTTGDGTTDSTGGGYFTDSSTTSTSTSGSTTCSSGSSSSSSSSSTSTSTSSSSTTGSSYSIFDESISTISRYTSPNGDNNSYQNSTSAIAGWNGPYPSFKLFQNPTANLSQYCNLTAVYLCQQWSVLNHNPATGWNRAYLAGWPRGGFYVNTEAGGGCSTALDATIGLLGYACTNAFSNSVGVKQCGRNVTFNQWLAAGPNGEPPMWWAWAPNSYALTYTNYSCSTWGLSEQATPVFYTPNW